MIAIIYSGSRYANWKLAEKGQIVSEFKTVGINPYFNDEKFITQLLNKNNELITNAEKIKKIYFFGAGASSAKRKQVIRHAFTTFFRYSTITIEHDLKAAALATCGDNAGIVGILGSGSNAAYFNGKTLKNNNNGLGFILNDEGSANWLGKHLLKDFLTDVLPQDFKQKFTKKYNLDRKQILDKIYKQPQPVLFLTSFSEFLLENRNTDYVNKLVTNGFKLFFENYIVPLTEEHPDTPLHFAGTISAGFESLLRDTATTYQLSVQSVIKAPIYNVLKYYTSKN